MNKSIFMFKKHLTNNNKQLEQILPNMSNLEIIMAINHCLKQEIYNAINKAIFSYKKVPITADDIYNEFLYECPNILRKYRYQSDSNFYAYVSQVVKNFCLNKLNFWLRKKRSIDLNMSSIDEMIYITDDSAENEVYQKAYEEDFKRLFYRYFSKNDVHNIQLLLSKKWSPHSTYKLNLFREIIVSKIITFYSA
ncbi:sigma-70 family RNA polymerase sigma factor [Mycoplasmopsis agalactiae]|nr:sigma-70 family RNA polymerase sigma factor [Mycoplasmopsis agalactiae]MCE6078633.1 sigma-70 family RNA polymerase sigma factor [Mycoplasmopsis agalactiae]MCE6095018.1 sigma-70 family RNA polymerase sigma factor [Mycoplasmopsis agalactiae]MCE6114278.1 sigma-70 family RNA polymerase sigma factor [Mycoplasmopsis agalactiae]